jgi:hypothetical protein
MCDARPRRNRRGVLETALASTLMLVLASSPLNAAATVIPSGDVLHDEEIHPVCLIGEWHVVDLTTYSRSAIHVGEIQSATGPYYWSFRQDGTFSQNADVTVVATSPAGDDFVQRMFLVSTGNFRDSRDMVLTFSDVITAGSVDVTVNGQPFIEGADPGGLAVSDTSHASYACDGDRLTLQPDFGDGRVAMMNMQRYRPS